MPSDSSVHTLVEFARVFADGAGSDDGLATLARVAHERLDVDAVAVLKVGDDGSCTLVAARGLPEGFTFVASDELVGQEIGDSLRSRLGGAFEQDRTMPLAFAGDVFGYLVILCRRDHGELKASQLELAEGLVGLAAAALHRTAQLADLKRTVSDLRASREALARGHKLRALGQMAAGVSHDLKNIINPLSLHLQLLKRIVPKDATDAQESIAEMQGVLKRGLDTIERLRDFSRQTPPKRAETSTLEKLAHEAIEICRPRMRTKHDAHYKLVEELAPTPAVMLVSSELVSAAVNLIVNAIDAMPSGGTITVSTGDTEGGAFLRVRDDGPGMASEVQQRVFEPFFTTKGDEGTGLGLAMVYAFVQRSRGKLTLDTAPGEGATFEMSFPPAPID